MHEENKNLDIWTKGQKDRPPKFHFPRQQLFRTSFRCMFTCFVYVITHFLGSNTVAFFYNARLGHLLTSQAEWRLHPEQIRTERWRGFCFTSAKTSMMASPASGTWCPTSPSSRTGLNGSTAPSRSRFFFISIHFYPGEKSSSLVTGEAAVIKRSLSFFSSGVCYSVPIWGTWTQSPKWLFGGHCTGWTSGNCCSWGSQAPRTVRLAPIEHKLTLAIINSNLGDKSDAEIWRSQGYWRYVHGVLHGEKKCKGKMPLIWPLFIRPKNSLKNMAPGWVLCFYGGLEPPQSNGTSPASLGPGEAEQWTPGWVPPCIDKLHSAENAHEWWIKLWLDMLESPKSHPVPIWYWRDLWMRWTNAFVPLEIAAKHQFWREKGPCLGMNAPYWVLGGVGPERLAK